MELPTETLLSTGRLSGLAQNHWCKFKNLKDLLRADPQGAFFLSASLTRASEAIFNSKSIFAFFLSNFGQKILIKIFPKPIDISIQ